MIAIGLLLLASTASIGAAALVSNHIAKNTESPYRLGLFRILYGIVLFCDVAQIYYYRHLVDEFRFLPEWAQQHFGAVLLLWLVSVAFLILGYHTRLAAIANYAFCMIVI